MIIRNKSKVLEIKKLSDTVINLTLEVPKDFKFSPGQYIEIKIPSKKEIIKRPYSISSSPNQNGKIELCIKNVNGPGTKYLFSLKEKDSVEIIGPIGPFKIKNPEKDLVFISTGTGIGPFRSMIKSLLESKANQKITLLVGYRTEKDILYDEEFKDLEKENPNFTYKTILSQPTNQIEKGYVQEILKQSLSENKNSDFYICGLYEMIEEVGKILSKNKVHSSRIFFEQYD